MHKTIVTCLANLNKAEKKLRDAVEKVQSTCNHPYVVEAPYEPSTGFSLWVMYFSYCSAFPPFRVCPMCGLSEEGWGCGYEKLKTAYGEVTRDKANSIRESFRV